VDRASVF